MAHHPRPPVVDVYNFPPLHGQRALRCPDIWTRTGDDRELLAYGVRIRRVRHYLTDWGYA